MPWRVTVRVGPRVERATHDSLQDALRALEDRAQALSDAGERPALDVRYRTYAPAQQVAARLELAGPQRLMPSVRAGLDVRGDGSSEAYLGRVRRQLVEPRRRETPVQALRRELTALTR